MRNDPDFSRLWKRTAFRTISASKRIYHMTIPFTRIESNPRRVSPFLLVGLTLWLLNLAPSFGQATHAGQLPQAAECQQGVGGRIFSTGGQVEVEILPADAGFTIELHLVSPGPDRLIATNRQPGSITKLGSF